MLIIAAALEEELETAKCLCPGCEKVTADNTRLWKGVLGGRDIFFLRAGVGPARAAARLAEALTVVKPSRILAIGYAGALDPGLKLGSVVAVQRALAFGLDEKRPSWDNVIIEGQFDLDGSAQLVESALAAGLEASSGDILTSRYVLGNPEHKRLLFEQFHASVVDMETAALARTAQSEGIPLSCIRAVSDEAGDSFLAPFSHDPSTGIASRAIKLMSKGMIETYREWKLHSTVAKESLRRFLAGYLEN